MVGVGAHPRAGGENRKTHPLRAPHSGSSPRGRGKRAERLPAVAHKGLIPARAGKTVV